MFNIIIICVTFQIYNNVNMYNVMIVHIIMIKDHFNVNNTSLGNSTLYFLHNVRGYF